nr:hypothetical protein GCM10020093_090070 [Planobispora longispora]
MAMVCREMDLDPKRYPPRSFSAQVSNFKNELIDYETAADRASTHMERTLAEAYRNYQQRLTEAGAMDFDDLIMLTVTLLQIFPDVAEHYRRRWRHVLVDEYQDTNHAQYTLIRELVGTPELRTADGDLVREGSAGIAPAELCVVGDADQSIYAFRGATIRNILEFERDYPNARTILLEQNYRSTQTILTAANAVISRNENRKPKNLWSDQGAGSKIVGYVADDEHDEAMFVAQEVDRLADEEGVTPGQVAVFYRTNAASRVFEETFIRTGLPYKVVGGVRFYERKEVRDLLAYLRVLANPGDVVSLRRILNVPKRGIGDRAEAMMEAFAARERVPFVEALRRADEAPGMATRSVNAIKEFVALLDDLVAKAGDTPPSILAQEVLVRTGYRAELENSEDPQDEGRLENLDELISVASEFEEASPEGTLVEFLEQVSLVADADQIPEADGGQGVVTLMTLHTAKGLEFPVVFLTAMEDGVFPTCAPWASRRSWRRSAGWPTSASPGPSGGSTCRGRRSAARGGAVVQPRLPVRRGDPLRAGRLAQRPAQERLDRRDRPPRPLPHGPRQAGRRPPDPQPEAGGPRHPRPVRPGHGRLGGRRQGEDRLRERRGEDPGAGLRPLEKL